MPLDTYVEVQRRMGVKFTSIKCWGSVFLGVILSTSLPTDEQKVRPQQERHKLNSQKSRLAPGDGIRWRMSLGASEDGRRAALSVCWDGKTWGSPTGWG